jgi:GNAT superfamily N-acetyltransferase
MGDTTIRAIAKGDEALVVALLRELADYEKLLDRFRITPAVVARDYLCDRPLLNCELAFADGAAAGIATWHWSYGSFAAARKIYLADLFVRPEFRGRQIGKALIGHLAKLAVAHGGIAVEWEVLDWNRPSIGFYDGLGATPISGWIGYSLAGEALTRLAKS